MTEEQETIERDERIERFLKGQMTPQEESVFKEDLSKDSDLKNRAGSMALLIKSMQTVGHGQKSDESVIDAVGVKPLVFTPKFLTWAGSIAATLLLCIGIFQYVYYNNTLEMANEFAQVVIPSDLDHYSPSGQSGTLRGEDSSTIAIEDTIKRDVEMEKTLKGMFSDIDAKKNLSEDIKMLEGFYNDAIQRQQCSYLYLTDDIAWNIAKAYLLEGKRKPAITILDNHLKTYPNTKIRQQIEEQIKKLK